MPDQDAYGHPVETWSIVLARAVIDSSLLLLLLTFIQPDFTFAGIKLPYIYILPFPITLLSETLVEMTRRQLTQPPRLRARQNSEAEASSIAREAVYEWYVFRRTLSRYTALQILTLLLFLCVPASDPVRPQYRV